MEDATPSGIPSSRRSIPGSRRHIGLLGATGVGVGAIVGGGILVLAGAAFAATGPAAIIAFAVNGVIAILTALSFAEMSATFPESGGAYTFAKKVLSVRAAFGVGWVLWFAYIVAGVLYALGFADYEPRVLAHSVLGCFFYGAFATKMIVVSARQAPWWALPVAGGLVFSALTGLWLTSALWFFGTSGLVF